MIGHYRSDLNGSTCVADAYLSETDFYECKMEHTGEELAIGHKNLKRRDRTPQDPGYYIEFKDGKLTRREFKSNEECQAFVASVDPNWVVKAGKAAAAEREAAAKAEAEAAAAKPDDDNSPLGSWVTKRMEKKELPLVTDHINPLDN